MFYNAELPGDVRDGPVLADDQGRRVPAELLRASTSPAGRRRLLIDGRCDSAAELAETARFSGPGAHWDSRESRIEGLR